MNEPGNTRNGTTPTLTAPAFVDAFKALIKEAVAEAVQVQPRTLELLEPDELAHKLKVPVSWVYEQSRQGKLPTHRIGKYIRFDLDEVLKSLRAKSQE